MSALNHDEYVAQRFLENIGVKLVKPEPIAVTKTAHLAKPQAPEQKPPAKPDKNNFPKRMSDELDAQIEFERHPDLFDDSPGGWENVRLVLDFIKDHHDGYPSRASVSDAISTLRRRGELLTLFRPEPAPKPVVVQTAVPATTVTPPPDPDAGLPPLPDYVKRALGSNPLRTRKDVNAIPSWLFSEIYRGPFGDEFRKRVNAALAR